MIKQYSWKHLGIASFLTIALCVGFLFYNKWDVSRFKKSLNEESAPIIQKQETKKIVRDKTLQQPTTLTPSETDNGVERPILEESDSKNSETEVAANEEKDAEAVSFDDFLDFLDELEAEEMATLIESLDLEDDEKEAFSKLTEQESEIMEDIHPSYRIIDMIESGVASLASLIELMEESTTVLPESVQERFEPVLQTLRTMQANNGALIVHRPPENPSSPMLLFINPSPSSQSTRDSLGTKNNVLYTIENPGDLGKELLILDKGNSTIIE